MKKNEEKVVGILKDGGDNGRTITELVALSRLPRSVVRILLARLEGAGRVVYRKVGMSKIYKIKEGD